VVIVVADSPDLATGRRLLDAVKGCGFTFARIAPGPDGPIEGVRENDQWRDVIHIGGFSSSCYAWRERQSSLIVPGGALVQIRTEGSPLDVLTEVLNWSELPT
jgi:hypothetical protein